MQLITDEQRRRMLENGRITSLEIDLDHHPVVKLFTPDAGCTWLLSELDPEFPDIAFGLCDLGVGCPELGTVSLAEISALRGRLGLPVEPDLHFTADKPLSAYAAAARSAGHIVS